MEKRNKKKKRAHREWKERTNERKKENQAKNDKE